MSLDLLLFLVIVFTILVHRSSTTITPIQNPWKRPCRSCGKQTSMRCSRCHEAYYCSSEHMTRDWKSHRSECRKSLNALLFPADNAAPAMVQIPYTDKVDTDNSIPGYPSKPYHALDIQILRKYIANTLEMKYVTRMGSRGQPLTQPLVAMFSGDWEGLPRNQCVAHLAGQEVGVPWAGDVLVLRQKGKLYDETYESATMEDVKAMQRFRAEYRDFEPYGF